MSLFAAGSSIGWVALARGAVRRSLPSFVLDPVRRIRRRGGGLETLSARYCYGVWLRHLVLADQQSLQTAPAVVAELGPGGSLGVGMAALLTGSSRYIALDVRRHPRAGGNLDVFDELVSLLSANAPIPSTAEFPDLRPRLGFSAFPKSILSDERLGQALAPARIRRLREVVEADALEYVAPWDRADVIGAGSIDLIISQAVMEHVADLQTTYAAMFNWLRPGGYMSHQIDLRSHRTSQAWNGHWAYPGWLWKAVQGAPINRLPLSAHVNAVREAGFSVVRMDCEFAEFGLTRRQLAPEWKHLGDSDLRCEGVFLQAVRPTQ